ncbi:MAG: hypothetical protein LBL59_09080 [Xanthomonadaceae bacterium]|jgi:hypothetical protein|nr:hypothetical protein [Xanthomonadaceae bacterium]
MPPTPASDKGVAEVAKTEAQSTARMAPQRSGVGSSGSSSRTGTRERDEDHGELTRSRSPAPAFPAQHRDYALFAAVRAYMPKGTRDEKTAELMYECKRDGIVCADRLKKVTVMDDNRAIAFGKTPGFYGEVSLNTPAPPLEQTLQQLQALDEKRVQQMEQFREQQAQINAQSEGGPKLVR